MNIVEQSLVLYYADYLSLKDICLPVTDNCKYYYIKLSPINSAYICDYLPFYDILNLYYVLAYTEYLTIKNKFGEDGVMSFLGDIAYLAAAGVVDAKGILRCIHRYSTKLERRQALRKYNLWKSKQVYTHIIVNNDGDPEEQECTEYVARAEQGTDRNPKVSYNKTISDGRELQESTGSDKLERLHSFIYG